MGVLVKDAMGHELKEGDLISIELPSPRLVCKISKLDGGGLSIAARGQQMPGVMQSTSVITNTWDPKQPWLPNVLKLHQPDDDKIERVKLN